MAAQAEGGESGSKMRAVVGKWLAVCCSVFVIYALATLSIQGLQIMALFLAFSLALVFVHYLLSPSKESGPIEEPVPAGEDPALVHP